MKVSDSFKLFLNNKELNHGKPDKDIVFNLISDIVYNGENKSFFFLSRTPNMNDYYITHVLDDLDSFIINLYISKNSGKFKLILNHFNYNYKQNEHVHKLAYCIQDDINNPDINQEYKDIYTYIKSKCKNYCGSKILEYNNIIY